VQRQQLQDQLVLQEFLQLLLIHHQDLQTREILGLTLQLEKFMFITTAIGLNLRQAILVLRVQQEQQVHREQPAQSQDQQVLLAQQVRQGHKETLVQQVRKVYM
jgi:hypothetical protein